MEEINFKKMQKRRHFIGIKVSNYEKAQIEEFCRKNEITISDLVRESVTAAITPKRNKNQN